MTRRRMYAKQEDDEGGAGRGGEAADDPQGQCQVAVQRWDLVPTKHLAHKDRPLSPPITAPLSRPCAPALPADHEPAR